MGLCGHSLHELVSSDVKVQGLDYHCVNDKICKFLLQTIAPI